ncbi:hypothetical protein C456_01292 [Haloferax volcanii DSM 14919]|uniref:Uncharacterized protein n=1 Tax=Haloferax lucentense (strain DSM 14919 / JCM 9276 / NCIMB 13854 / Aa 2.2) TaxID=1230452 RepID=M0H728_HALL2|nr:hypothetical protein C456_01292 [Haloferax lucentense DSM 14919]
MRHIWPSFVEQRRVNCISLLRGNYPLSIQLMDVGFFRCEKARAEPRTNCAEGKYGSDSAAICNSASGNDRCVGDGIYDMGDQRECCNVALNVAACFPALCNDNIDTSIDSSLRLFSTSHRLENDPIARMNLLGIRCGLPK